jgi:hypothetical protein
VRPLLNCVTLGEQDERMALPPRFLYLPCSTACHASLEPAESAANSLHAETAKVLAIRAPRYTGTGTKADALQFINSEVRVWLTACKAATRTLIARLEAACADAAPGSRGIAVLHADVASSTLPKARSPTSR